MGDQVKFELTKIRLKDAPISKIIISRVAATLQFCWQKHPKTWTFSSPSFNPTFIRHLFFSVFLLFETCIKKEVKTISAQKHPNIFGIKELLKTDITENKEDYSENSKKLKDISNTDKETKQTTVLENKEPLKTDKTENFSDKTKVDGSENSEKKLKNISNKCRQINLWINGEQ